MFIPKGQGNPPLQLWALKMNIWQGTKPDTSHPPASYQSVSLYYSTLKVEVVPAHLGLLRMSSMLPCLLEFYLLLPTLYNMSPVLQEPVT